MKSGLRQYVLATRFPFVTVSILPVVFTSIWVWKQTNTLDLLNAILIAIGVACAHIGANTLNDFFDWDKSDAINRKAGDFSGGSRRVLENRFTKHRFLFLSILFFGIAGAVLLCLFFHGFIFAFAFAGCGALLGIMYSLPPFSLQSRGLGEVSIFLAFGPLITAGTGYILTGNVIPEHFYLGIPFGLLTLLIVWVNEIPDIDADRATGKRTIPVRIGEKRASIGAAIIIVFFVLSVIGLALIGVFAFLFFPFAAVTIVPLFFLTRGIILNAESYTELLKYQAGMILFHSAWSICGCIVLLL